jgi:hypothetical protein
VVFYGNSLVTVANLLRTPRGRGLGHEVIRGDRGDRSRARHDPAGVDHGSKYPEWDSGVERVEGRIAPGEKIKLHVTVNPSRAFPVKVTEFTPGQSMRWTGGMPLGLFKGVRTFRLARQANGETS